MSELPLRHPSDDYTILNLDVGRSSPRENTVVGSTIPDEVDLIDISSNKQWVCYVHYETYDNNQKKVKISRTRLKAFNEKKNQDEYISGDDKDTKEDKTKTKVFEESNTSNIDFDLTGHYKSIENCSRFLSISSNGNFIALSCHNANSKERKNSSCIIFHVVKDEIKYFTEIKHRNGRAVFLDREKDEICLAIINSNRLEMYSYFTKSNKSPCYFYDLTSFELSTKKSSEYIAHQRSFFSNASWAHINNKDKEEKLTDKKVLKLMTLSRHIRHDVIATPFVDQGIVRLWSVKDDGVRLTSFSAPNEHVVALSKDLKYAATIRDGIKAVKIYNVKNGLLVYTLQSRFKDDESLLVVTHVRFCYGSRYLALSGFLETRDEEEKLIKTEVVFEVWYIEAEKSIYEKKLDAGGTCEVNTITVKPFVIRGLKEDEEKCLKGVYTFTNDQNKGSIYCVELEIDEKLKSNSQVTVEWLECNKSRDDIKFSELDDYEIENDITDNTNLKCANIILEDERFYIRFGNRMIQLWKLGDPDAFNDQEKEDQLVYIRAYKGPSYGRRYSFRDTWVIKEFDSIRFIEGAPYGRVILNIKREEKEGEKKVENSWTKNEDNVKKNVYHTDEIFLPLTNDDISDKTFDYHTFESACQALHYLNWCWERKQDMIDKKKCDIDTSGWGRRKIDISSWNQVEDGKKEKVEFKLKLLDYDQKEKPEKINIYEKNKKYKENLQNLFVKTFEIIKKAVTESSHDESNYFATMSGSRTLAMLADFSKGRDIIKLLLKNKTPITFSIFSYTKQINNDNKNYRKLFGWLRRKDEWKKKKHDGMRYRDSPKIEDIIFEKFPPISESENVLTVLIDNLEYDLYELMFNRILSDSKKIGPGCLTALADALLFLQYEGHTDLLQSSSQKLSYLAMDISVLGVLTHEKDDIIKIDEYNSKIRNLESHSTMEQLKKYNLNLYDYLYYKLYIHYSNSAVSKNRWNAFKGKWTDHAKKYENQIKEIFRTLFDVSSKSDPKDRTKLCVIPLPYFNTYNTLLEDRTKVNAAVYKNASAFVAIASNQNSSSIFRQGDTVLEVMLQYKWKKFLRKRFICVCLISTVYYAAYCFAVLFALELYDYRSENEDRFISTPHMASIICMSVSGSLLLFQEIRQVIMSKKWMDYLSSGYNWVDFAAFTLPPITLVQLVKNWDFFYEVCSVTTLILWLRIIIRLRVISFVGITLETIIQLSRKVWSILFIFLLVVLAFTSSFIVLFRHREDTYFQETFHGITSMYSSDTPANGQIPITVGNTTLHDVSSDNGFADPFKAFYQVWLVIFGVWDPLINGEAGDDKMVFILCMLFALITVLIFTNMVIALMSSTVDEVKNKGNTVWVSHFASVVAEVEQLWCLPSTRRNRNNNPSYIYYTANHGVVKRQEEKLEEETKELRRKVLDIN